MIIPIKNIRKWRISCNDTAWVIQERTKNKGANEWTNKYFFAEIKSLIPTLVDLGISESNLSDIMSTTVRIEELKAVLLDAIEDIFIKTAGKLPESKRITSVKKSIKDRSTKKKKKKKTKKKG